MIRQLVTLPERNDPAGAGHFGAPRGTDAKGRLKTHRGIDCVCLLEQPVLSPVAGTVTKIGRCYSDSRRWKYVQVTDRNGLDHRVFYLVPSVEVGTKVTRFSVIGTADDITERYPDSKMEAHLHYEVKRGRQYLNPETLEPA